MATLTVLQLNTVLLKSSPTNCMTNLACEQQFEFLRRMTVGILSERRSTRPIGIDGGQPAVAGLNLLVRRNGKIVNLGRDEYNEGFQGASLELVVELQLCCV